MAKRSITDTEIGLIKALLARGEKNKNIQFYFNRQDRAVNSGRITQIRDKTYGPEVPQASEDELNRFLATFKSAEIGAVMIGSPPTREPTLEERARSLFENRGRSGWFLKTHESETTECKESFCLKPEHRFADPLRSIAGLANNGGGFVFFGVKELPDGSLSVVGMQDDAFAKADPAEINRCLAGALVPVPTFSVFVLNFDGNIVGVVHVEKHELPPVIAIKMINTEVREGAIYYRYVGETRMIKPGELQQIIAYREQKAVAEFSNRISRVAMGAAATLDLDTGMVDGRVGRFMIGEDLLPKIQFIREGQFAETIGTPTLRLIGDIQIDGSRTKVIRSNLTSDACLRAFLKNEPVEEPIQYVLHLAHSTRDWVPIWYYLQVGGISVEHAIDILKSEPASQPVRRDKAIARLLRKNSAYKNPSGKSKELLKQFLADRILEPNDEVEDKIFTLAVQGLPKETKNIDRFREILLSCLNRSKGDSSTQKTLRSYISRAACRLDEIRYGI
ncbi:helix-turn-helix domain-containing protein [Prosthecomicrobium hirschii]|uniref:AlbA family DNA-binding domain-containing protein n=1 Tax=Prosthecodimorpha hirschii TaxID=665126 RepID=UPI0011267BBC|nr:ATP-binding protein [Prosthecomicrobium hirschii]MCW1841570.1 ATP-binding protein [Prosthecomicrobium hirschii]TPQ49385.1 hypothetical protein C2U72_18855 [Prosthecomicrobium hirschii]